jgi:hypothetical protein
MKTKDVLLSPEFAQELRSEIHRIDIQRSHPNKYGLRYKRSAYESLRDWLHSEDVVHQFINIYALILLKECKGFSAAERHFIESLGTTVLKITASKL